MESAPSVEVRSLEADEIDAFVDACDTAFGTRAGADELEKQRGLFELERAVVADDGRRIIGTARAHSFEITVPGGTAAAAGLTSLAVLPTHRRRGVLTELLRRQLDDVRDRGESLALLTASEGSIYGRFGFASAVPSASWELAHHTSGFSRRSEATGDMRLAGRDEAFPVMAIVYDAIRDSQPGLLARYGRWWDQRFPDTPSVNGAGPLFYAIHSSEEGAPDGYVVYRVRQASDDGGPSGTVHVAELMAADTGAYAALWRYCLDIDLITSVRATLRPVDEPLQWMLADPRRLQLHVRDHVWLRIVDLPEALVARGYYGTDRLVLQVSDDFCKWNAGKVELISSPEGIECGPVSDTADLLLDAEDLAAVYLGGATFSALARAGRVVEGTPGALARADILFRTNHMPWCSTVF
jgi:predicted acetyltransferase